ncbi:MAG: pyruvate kinase [Peptoniphilaceae bacterium]|nr:pyruvate kinase [Peptoniphilaceae bacterium]MDY3076279.1 pyruvate kinase [Peptoniphilaceae bacterium]
MNKTKIVCTIGPASQDEETLRQLIQEGMNVARLNFSHGSHEEQGNKVRLIRKLREEMQIPLAVALDTKGPEIRTGIFQNGEKITLQKGEPFTLTTRDVEGTQEMVSVSYKNLPHDVHAGMHILIDDGLLDLLVHEVKGTEIHCIVQNQGQISDHKGINIPGAEIHLPAMTEQDQADILFGIEAGIDMIFASFIRTAQDVMEIRRLLQENDGGDILIFSKIESQQGVNNLDAILDASDGVMVARGDLGVEIPTENVPLVQKEIIRKANRFGKPVITATQMLDSMQRNPRPTRAEVNDVANAILDGSDAIMLSGETASGNYPLLAVRQMRVIAETTEASPDFKKLLEQRKPVADPNVSTAIARSACTIAGQLSAAAIVASTSGGFTGRQISRFRPDTPIIACTPNERVYHQLSIVWGVMPVMSRMSVHTDELVERSIVAALHTGVVHEGDQIVLTAGIPVGKGQSTNLIKVHTIGDIIISGQGVGSGMVTGRVCVGSTLRDISEKFQSQDILVCKFADAELIPYIERAGGIISEEGGQSSLAAVVGSHYNRPTVIGAVNAVKVMKDGDIVTIDADTGVVYAGEVQIM